MFDSVDSEELGFALSYVQHSNSWSRSSASSCFLLSRQTKMPDYSRWTRQDFVLLLSDLLLFRMFQNSSSPSFLSPLIGLLNIPSRLWSFLVSLSAVLSTEGWAPTDGFGSWFWQAICLGVTSLTTHSLIAFRMPSMDRGKRGIQKPKHRTK